MTYYHIYTSHYSRLNKTTKPLSTQKIVPFTSIYFKMKNSFQTVRSTKKFFDQSSALRAACDTSIAHVTGCVYPREGYRSVTPLLMPGSTGLRRQPCSAHGNCCITRIEGDKTRHPWNSMHETIIVIVFRVNFWSGLLGSTGFVRKSLCIPCKCGRPAEVQRCRVTMEHAVDVDRYCSEVISLLLLMQCKGTLTHLF